MAISKQQQGQALLDKYRQRDGVAARQHADPDLAWLAELERQLPQSPQSPKIPDEIRAYPSLLLALYDAELSRVAWVYMLCRLLDVNGHGWLNLAHLRSALTDKQSDYYITGKRNLRGILKQGEGVTWQRDESRLWYRSPDKILVSLNAGRLTGKPVLMPVNALLGGIASFKAHILSAWHCGRKRDPITRKSTRKATGIPESTQYRYDKLAGIAREKNHAIGGVKTKASYQDAIYEHGRHVQTFTDHIGKMGKRGQEYISWRIADTVVSPLQQTVKGRQRKINRAIAVVNEGMQPNGNDINRLYYESDMFAASAITRDPDHDVYWPMTSTHKRTASRKPKLEPVRLWSVYEGVTS